MSKRRAPDGTVQQRVFDAIQACSGTATMPEIQQVTGLDLQQIRNALSELNRGHKVIEICPQPTLYRLMPNAKRPNDGRGTRE